MKNSAKFTFMPEYMMRFKCDGVTCEDTCCAGWGINIDENTFKRYSKTKDEDFKNLLGNRIRENSTKTFLNYGSMAITDDNKCPFLNKNHLCDIHGGFGEEDLCITCYNYPRVFNIVDDVYEKSALMSCPIAAKLALLNKEKMEFLEGEEFIDDKKIEVRRIFDIESMSDEYPLIEYFWEIRVLSINILQNRNYSIEERLNILEVFYREISNGNVDNVLADYEFKNEHSNFIGLKVDSCELNEKELLSLCDDQFCKLIKSKRFLEIISGYKNALNKHNDKNIYENFSKLKEIRYIIENYIVNYFFNKIMPFSDLECIGDSLNVLKNHYKVIKAYILGIYMYNNNFVDENEIIRVIQCFSRCIEHNVEATRYIYEQI